ncbi:MAG: SUMF1/EgtB/PvdO family nonheme iron enzyme [Candidatus Eisenbacteria bacterium]|uniref:SUMF1/EgtB/PvdO family nonheme iron enzyme n=1 Tax=Eiseniibacteriota bacterium TaxID=2212470 RepID=A0A937XBJ1_UNCEI|nr:SUMF1/EgtB/PvdO family nonheme iron enzyme [Candidatus Eisenbacteria bacterium]
MTDLAVAAVTDTSATLNWSAPGDDGSVGTAAEYDLRWSSERIDAQTWSAATRVPDAPEPQPAGSEETCTVAGLASGTVYYFALKSADEVGNWSSLSNVASDTTASGEPPENPVLALSPAQLDFGAVGTSLPFTITNTGTGTLTWEITDDQPWLSVTPTSGSTTTEADEITVTIDRTGLNPDDYSGTVTVTPGSGSAQNVAIQMSVSGGGGGNFVLLQSDTFIMGSPTDELCRWGDETQHEVTLTRGFYVGVTEVTQAQWQATMGWNDSGFSGPDRPVEGVTWFDAVSYCNQRSVAEGFTPAYMISNPGYEGVHIVSATVTWNQNANGYRLLTEAEWEYACRAGSVTAFCNGGISQCLCGSEPFLDLVGWYCGNSGSQTHDVGQKAANAWGLYDMHGNVWEWCWDWKGDYGGPAIDPTGPAFGAGRVVRGGSWVPFTWDCRSASRSGYSPHIRYDLIGLRLARTAF